MQLGAPLELDELVDPDAGPDDAEAVRSLTDAIDAALRDRQPRLPGHRDGPRPRDGGPRGPQQRRTRPVPSLAAREELARRLGRAPQRARRPSGWRWAATSTLLHGLRLNDGDLTRPAGPRPVVGSALGTALLVAALGSLVVATAVVNVWPALLVAAVSLLVANPVAKGSVRALVGLVVFPVAWITAATIAVDGPLARRRWWSWRRRSARWRASSWWSGR